MLFLDLVRKEKEEELAYLNGQLKIVEAVQRGVTESFSSALKRASGAPIKLIGEVKPSSPSSNNFDAENRNILDLVNDYREGGVNAISVLTDKKHFSGGYDLLRNVASHSNLPLLQKEFVIDPVQMKMGKACGASAVLLLTHYFNEKELKVMLLAAEDIGLEPVLEISVEEELDRALSVNPKILLINNRAISLLPVNPTASYLKGEVQFSRSLWGKREDLREWKSQSDRVLISASCFSKNSDLKIIEDLPYDAILMGNALSGAPDVKEFLRNFLGTNS
jgi:indole-3-glycerol phosphate synthase